MDEGDGSTKWCYLAGWAIGYFCTKSDGVVHGVDTSSNHKSYCESSISDVSIKIGSLELPGWDICDIILL